MKVMQQVAISDRAYSRLQRAAAARSMTVGAYIEDLVSQDIPPATADNHERMFTPERLALIDAAEADALAGNVYTPEQVRDFIQQKHDAWLQTHPN